MEALELLVESSELALKAVAEKEDADSLQSVVVPTQLTLKLSFYDLAPVLDVPPMALIHRLHEAGASR